MARHEPSEPSLPPRRGWTKRLVLLILVTAGAWRWSLATASPCIARDGVLYCWQARDLGREGLPVLREGRYDQHPLYSIAILGVQRLMLAGSVADSPLTWERSGQIVAGFAGMAVVLLCGLLTLRLARRATRDSAARASRCATGGPSASATGSVPEPPEAGKRSAADTRAYLIALALASLLPLNAWLSADVMSDQLHAALYLSAAVLIVDLRPRFAALACGLLAGLAFLTRPEGAVVAAGGVAALLVMLRSEKIRFVGPRIALLTAGFVLVALPYVWMSGQLSPKLDKEKLEQFQPAAEPSAARCHETASFAALVRRETAWYALTPAASVELFRAGRVVIPLLAIPALVVLARRRWSPALVGWGVCAGGHFALCILLLERHGYLDPRHLLPLVLLLIPFAAASLAWLFDSERTAAFRRFAWPATAATLLVLAWYAARVPNESDGYIRDHANRLQTREKPASERKLVAGSSGRRIAFYADVRWQPWAENEADAERRYEDLYGHVVGGQADYLAIETGPGAELAGNDALLRRLGDDPAVRGRVAEAQRVTVRGEITSHLWAFDWTRPAR